MPKADFTLHIMMGCSDDCDIHNMDVLEHVLTQPLSEVPITLNDTFDQDIMLSKHGIKSCASATDYYALEEMTLNSEEDDDSNNVTMFERKNDDDLTFKSLKQKESAKCGVGLIICIGTVICVLAAFILYLSFRGHPEVTTTRTDGSTSTSAQPFRGTYEWQLKYPTFPSESCVRLVDVDEDGRDDVIFGYADTSLLDQDEMVTHAAMKRLCMRSVGRSPCIGRIDAVSGHSGKVLWTLDLQMDPFEINCGNGDFNGDGKPDCIAAGRMSTCTAFDPRTGKVIWNVDRLHLQFTWNIYNPLVLQDLTGDGVADVLIAHGGDPTRAPTDHHRPAGRLLLLDGATGVMIGSRYLNMSAERETYNSPVAHTTADGSQYILYGDGGETVDGHFKGISLPDLYRCVHELEATATVPNTRGSYQHFMTLKRDRNGVFDIYASVGKGMMVAPTLVDMNSDGTDDILVVTFDSRITLYDGETMTQIWTNDQFSDYETYSQLAPGYFNNDTHLDFMLHMNRGIWPHYSSSLTVILDGLDGDILWTLNSTGIQMTSDLVISTRQPYRDAFLFRLKGVDTEDVDIVSRPQHGAEEEEVMVDTVSVTKTTRKRRRREAGDVRAGFLGDDIHPVEGNMGDIPNPPPAPIATDDSSEEKDLGMVNCKQPQGIFSYRYVLVDRSCSDRPLVIRHYPAVKYRYNKAFRQMYKAKGQSGTACTVINSAETNTGILGDVDGDGDIDMISLTSSSTLIHEHNMTGQISQTTLRKVNLADIVGKHPSYLYTDDLELWRSPKLFEQSKLHEKPLHECDFAPLSKQRWRGYLGNHADSKYRT